MSIRHSRRYFLTSLVSMGLISLIPSMVRGQVPTEKTLLWEISGNGLAQSSYLYGTIHSICVDKLRITQQQKKVLDTVQQLYLEIDLTDISLGLESEADSIRHGDKTLQELMTAQEYRKVKNFFEKELRTPIWMVSRLNISELISRVLSTNYDTCETNAWDTMLAKAAKNRNIGIFGLESVQERSESLDPTPIKQQIGNLIKTIDNRTQLIKESKKSYREMQAIYASQDVDRIYKFSTQVSTDKIQANFDRQVSRMILDQRNRNWVPRIAKISQEKPTLFAVGAAHLGGEQGVISLLRNMGYRVTPIMNIWQPTKK
jgi:uncharacterized protein